ncbi:MAG: GTPase HflX, partial [Sedimentisphaerales bacterium]|nr:GTPase HflX [Sedimentisphaerales bacterium]
MERTRETLKVRDEVALLVTVLGPGHVVSSAESLDELESLAASAGARIVGRICQKRRSPHPGTYVGHGKALQIAEFAQHSDANTIIFDNDLSPAQIRELEEITQCKVLDRSELILDIFASRAQTYEARLQVELAQLEYTYPRLTRMWSHLDT